MDFDPQMQEIETKYLLSRSDCDLMAFYSLMVARGKVYLGNMVSKLGLRFSSASKAEKVHDAVTRLLELYMRPEPKSRNVQQQLHLELTFQLHNRKAKLWNKVGTLCDNETVPMNPEKTLKQNYIKKILEDNINGKHIIVDLYRFRYYKRAILAIEKYTTRRWIYDHAQELRLVWEMTRVKK